MSTINSNSNLKNCVLPEWLSTKFLLSIQQREISAKYQLLFGIFGTIFYLQPYISWMAQAHYIDSILRLKVWAGALCSLLVVLLNSQKIPTVQKKVLPIFWYCTILYSLPIFSIFSLLATDFNAFWLINSIFCNLALSLVTSWRTFITLNIVGTIIGYLMYATITGNFAINFNNNDGNIMIYHYFLSLTMCYTLIYAKERNIRIITKVKDKLAAINHYLQLKIEQKTKYLKSSLNAKETFLNNISHEMRAPMQGIYGVAQELHSNWNHINEEQKLHHIKLITQSSDRLISLLCDLLDLGKLNANQMKIHLEKYDLQELISNVIQDLTPLSITKKIPINFQINNQINSVTLIDRIRISQVVRNLISNALKYSNSGEILVSVSYDPNDKQTGSNLMVQVKDAGIGIPNEELNVIFLPFIQSSKTKNKADSTGLGLAICAEIINLHKGRIWANNNDDAGATFSFTVPKLEITAQSIQNQIIQKINQLGHAMILDDDPLVIDSGKIILSSIGLNILSASNAVECIEKMRANKISILFLDMMMIDMTGTEFLQILRQHREFDHIKVIIVSGIQNYKDTKEAMELGAIAHFTKPYNKAQITQGIINLFQDLI